MKQISIILIALFSVMVLSCSPSNKKSIDRLNNHIEKVEKNYKTYSSEDWELANLEFEAIVAQIEENYHTMTNEEREIALKAIGRYYGLAAKQGFEDAAQEVQKIYESLPSLIDGFMDAFR